MGKHLVGTASRITLVVCVLIATMVGTAAGPASAGVDVGVVSPATTRAALTPVADGIGPIVGSYSRVPWPDDGGATADPLVIRANGTFSLGGQRDNIYTCTGTAKKAAGANRYLLSATCTAGANSGPIPVVDTKGGLTLWPAGTPNRTEYFSGGPN